jgi:hypothetical protein
MTISNQFLRIPPDHPLAQKFYDAIQRQFALIELRNAAHGAGEVERLKLIDVELDAVDDAIREMQNEIRQERGADESCTVGLTYDRNGFPVVNGRPGGPTLN